MSWSDHSRRARAASLPPAGRKAGRRRLLVLLGAGLAAAPVLAGCGFKPLYGARQANDTRAELAQIQVPPPASRLHQMVYVPLVDRLNPTARDAETLYRLDMALSESESGVLITRGDTVTRINLTLSVGFNLVDLKSGDSLFTGTAKSVASYNVLTSDFANLTAYDNARQRAAEDLAEQLSIRLGVFFATPRRG